MNIFCFHFLIIWIIIFYMHICKDAILIKCDLRWLKHWKYVKMQSMKRCIHKTGTKLQNIFFLWWELSRPVLPANMHYNIISCSHVLHAISLWLIHFTSGGLYLLTPFTHFSYPSHLPAGNQLCSLYPWVLFCSFVDLFLCFSMYKLDPVVFVFLCLTCFS